MKNNKKKGFTLVELLVVIAIIAILATVSVVGYTAFLKKANQSNALNELSQVKDAVNAVVLDGDESVEIAENTVVDFTYANNELTAKVGEANATADQVEAAILKLAEKTLGTEQDLVATVTDGKVSTVVYTYAEGATATWTIADAKVAN